MYFARVNIVKGNRSGIGIQIWTLVLDLYDIFAIIAC